MSYTPVNKVRIVTAASLFDGHDAAINIMRRILQSKGAEIIHLGHNRSVAEIVECAIEEDAQGIAITSYQGGHVEFFKYMKDLLDENGCGHIKIFGGGGGTILPQEITELHNYGITRIYSPDDGRRLGLEGMIEDVIEKCSLPPTPSGGGGDGQQLDYWQAPKRWNGKLPLGEKRDIRKIARAITLAENKMERDIIYDGSSITVNQFKADPFIYKRLKEFALEHRKDATLAEDILWDKLKNKKEGYRFRRQHIIGNFIADFVSLKKGLVIEVDGNYHQLPEMKISDEERTNALNKLGFQVIRFTNDEITYELDKTLDKVHLTLAQLPDKEIDENSSEVPDPPSTGGGRRKVSRREIPVLGITGTGGAGKSSVTDEIVRRYLNAFPEKTIAVISVDPSKKKTGGALLGDRIRMNSIHSPRAYMRSLATRDSDIALSEHVQEAIDVCKEAAFDLIILESAGVGQSDVSILEYCDVSLYVMTPEYGAASQLEKINMLDYADVIAINKFDKSGALDALHDVRKQYKRNHGLWSAKDEELPVIGSIAAQFNDAGINELFEKLMVTIKTKTGVEFGEVEVHAHLKDTTTKSQIIPPNRIRYLSEISDANRNYDVWVKEQCALASQLYQVQGTLAAVNTLSAAVKDELATIKRSLEEKIHSECRKLIEQWPTVVAKYKADVFEYQVRDKVFKQPMSTRSLSGTRIPKVVLPKYNDWGDILQWQLQENIPGEYPFTAGVFPLKREGEDPTRMFAGEGGPERTNKRFHYVSLDQPARRLSTAFDSVTLYGEDPAHRPDIYGKVGNSGVSIATVDDAKKLYSGFDLCDPKTSVSMTINGPAPIILAFFMNAAIDQQCEKYIEENKAWGLIGGVMREKFEHLPKPTYFNPSAPERLPDGNDGLGLKLLGFSGEEVLPDEIYERIKGEALAQVRGTVQADILKEDQAQNTCIFSTEFALKLMGDVQEYFIQQKVRNFYSVSISGYHIAEAGANPITQLAFTLANGFTYVEYYLSRGMHIDEFAPNLSFFFSNGMDAEYSVIGRVARRIWAKAMKYKYKGNDRSQKLKYHIQTSGRSLHAQEIDFNDIRTTLQALYAIYDNCNSLHTNAYDEAITTPTEESVRRAMAIQLIINRELGSTKTENFIQGSFLIEEMTDLVEEAVLAEFDRITERGGVLGAMERMYQRNKIQEESLYYESMKHNGELPIIGVNTFLNKKGSPTVLPGEVIRSTTEEKEQQIQNLHAFWKRNENRSADMLSRLKNVAINNGNIFAELMETVKYCSLGQITHALFEVGGQYRRNM
ncbi:methylmalonyl-CoA mutase family protein [Niastella sp. OAS944]|uniref:methylmalonyl-CoA mutase family protein n=1 Tax=Niastella sp. OAS944 TaxID=2664089 RepID=UPI00347A3A11|nr:methylmalonyl-CoA mutase [Chitinophagaceae bacterium OAS944]